jgi:antitoxin (DNA-binding transcriptional repressor) of toxin-antitoxin stability system
MTRIVYRARTHLSALADAAEGGEEIIIGKNGVAKGRLAPIGPRNGARKPSS